MSTPLTVLDQWLERQLEPAAREWYRGRRDELASGYSDRALHITLGMIPRRLGKQDLNLDAHDLDQAQACRQGWDPRWWSVPDAARVAALLATEQAGNQPSARRFEDLCRSADVGELIALYRGLPLYSDPSALEAQAGEGLRTNMRSVFEAVAHRSPYPYEQFSQDRWNHMVLKALFIGSTLAPIARLDERANPELARILCDYAHERWAANRPVTPELWRCVGPFAEGSMIDDLQRVLSSDSEQERCAAALALSASNDPRAANVLSSAADLQTRIESGALSWSDIDTSSA